MAYFVNQAGQRTLITRNDIDLNDIVYTAADYIKDEQLVPKDCTFWKCTSS
jgi:hypothetical protein